MKQLTITTVLGCLFITLTSTCHTASASADTASDCRQEALYYGLSTEELDDYINGCMASRGELFDGDTSGIEYVPPAEMEEVSDPQTDDTDELSVPQTGDTDVAQ